MWPDSAPSLDEVLTSATTLGVAAVALLVLALAALGTFTAIEKQVPWLVRWIRSGWQRLVTDPTNERREARIRDVVAPMLEPITATLEDVAGKVGHIDRAVNNVPKDEPTLRALTESNHTLLMEHALTLRETAGSIDDLTNEIGSAKETMDAISRRQGAYDEQLSRVVAEVTKVKAG